MKWQHLSDLGPACPDDELLAAFVDGTLHNPERIRVSEHLNYCPRCYETVSETRAVLQMVQRDRQVAQDEVREEYRRQYDRWVSLTHDQLQESALHARRPHDRTHDD